MLTTVSISTAALASVIDQSVDCVKLLDLGGDVLWMNSNGVCAMEIDDVSLIYGRQWPALWPEESRGLINDSLASAKRGEKVRFNAFCPTAKGSPRWWSVTIQVVHDPDGSDIGFLAISRDVTDAELQRRSLAIAAEELRHRLKNTYAMVCGLMSSLAAGNPENEAFVRDMNARLRALGTSQALFKAPDVPHNVAELLPALVQPFARPDCDLRIEGETRSLVARPECEAIALAVGELAMNSSKHGAFSEGGSIAIETHVDQGRLTVTWDETSTNPVAATSRTDGKGLDLIQMMVEAHRGSFDIEWRSHGPLVRLTLPALD